jgi:DnaJ-class molecular chaperone
MDHSQCANSDLDPHEAERRGLCGDCGGQGELISNFGGQHTHVQCPTCDGSGTSTGQ